MPAKKPNRIASAHELAIAIRSGFSPALYVEWQLTILDGHRPELVRGTKGDPDTWYVRPVRGGVAPTLEEQTRALKDLVDRGYGAPVQSIALNAELRTISINASAALPTGTLTPGQVFELGRVLGLQAGAPPASASVIDAECVEVPASASTDDASSSDDDDEQDLEQPAPTTASEDDDDE